MDHFVFYATRVLCVVAMAYCFHFGIKERRFFPSVVFVLVGCWLLDVIIALEELRP